MSEHRKPSHEGFAVSDHMKEVEDQQDQHNSAEAKPTGTVGARGVEASTAEDEEQDDEEDEHGGSFHCWGVGVFLGSLGTG